MTCEICASCGGHHILTSFNRRRGSRPPNPLDALLSVLMLIFIRELVYICVSVFC